MNQDIHLDQNPPFILEPGNRIIIPPGANKYFARPRQPYGARMLPCMAFLQMVAGERGTPLRFRFAEKPTSRGLRFFLPKDLLAGDQIVVIWRAPRSAAAVQAEFYSRYRDLFDESGHPAPDPAPEAWRTKDWSKNWAQETNLALFLLFYPLYYLTGFFVLLYPRGQKRSLSSTKINSQLHRIEGQIRPKCMPKKEKSRNCAVVSAVLH
jgi:hypothetical protein